MKQADLAPFQKLVQLVEHELEVLAEGDPVQLQDAVAETGAHIRRLPDPAPQAARALIERARGMRGRVEIEAERLLDGIGIARASVRRKKTVARTYGPPCYRDGYSTSV